MKITYGKSVHDNAEIKAVLNVLKTSTQMGKNVRKLEKIVSEMFNKKYGVQPAFKHLRKYNKVNTFKNSDYIMKNSILVGLHQELSKDNILKVVKNIDKFIKN